MQDGVIELEFQYVKEHLSDPFKVMHMQDLTLYPICYNRGSGKLTRSNIGTALDQSEQVGNRRQGCQSTVRLAKRKAIDATFIYLFTHPRMHSNLQATATAC